MEQAAGRFGEVLITVRYGWDGVSVKPECDGPLVNGTGVVANRWAVRAVNTGQVTYYAHTTARNGQPKTWILSPGQTATATAVQASSNGFSTRGDFDNLVLTTEP